MNIEYTGIHSNDAKHQYEAWAVNQRTGEKVLLGTCTYEAGEAAKKLWSDRIWKELLLPRREDAR